MLKRKKSSVQQTTKRSLVAHTTPKAPIAEQYRTIRTNIEFSSVDQNIRSLMITSASPGEGKSTTTANLATVFAQQGKRVLLIDADLRKPTAHYTFRAENFKGLTTVLSRKSTLADAIQTTEVANLDLLSSGPIPPNPSELIGSQMMKNMLEEAYENYDFIIFDTPPILSVTDAQILANQCDATILVVKSGSTVIDTALKAKDLLQNARGKLLGVVLNEKKVNIGEYYYYGQS
ncbi:CpsD/CapB family tyrosine-protein kinase [Priestia endophytica]|uniref:CpsD/CapB family tyrosine-protein kinase n=1 Tax=Priestia endophytica TaxID=135735 RepID=UPI000F52D180|nr:CpsD/CapB family tyrosine-protein kinase [Priestia endophytica]MED4072350.1 CpsD/CapB family tyrosine-protein kinase [Priestia endophytica]RPK12656.1 Tyrosine-protein kinase EpsD [Priestia endophytica]